jgi:hypothetical protein
MTKQLTLNAGRGETRRAYLHRLTLEAALSAPLNDWTGLVADCITNPGGPRIRARLTWTGLSGEQRALFRAGEIDRLQADLLERGYHCIPADAMLSVSLDPAAVKAFQRRLRIEGALKAYLGGQE